MSTKYYQNISKGMEALECQRYSHLNSFKDNISNKEHGSAVILVCEPRTGPDIYVYQIALSMKAMELNPTFHSMELSQTKSKEG